MNDVERQLGTRNATILMIFGGAFHLYLGYASFQLSVIIPDPFHTIMGTIMIVFGLLTFCVSVVVWLQKSWATKIITVVGVAVCAALVILGFYVIILIIAPIYWVAINQFRRVIEHSDWHEN